MTRNRMILSVLGGCAFALAAARLSSGVAPAAPLAGRPLAEPAILVDGGPPADAGKPVDAML